MIKLSYRQSEKYTLGALSIFHQKNKIDYSISIPILIYSYFIRTRGTNVIFNFRRFEVLIIRVIQRVDNLCIDTVNNLHFPDLNGDGEISSNDLIETVQRLMWPHYEGIDTAEAEHVARIVSFHTA